MGTIIKVLVIDDSAFNRRAIEEMLNSSAEIEVIGVAVDGEDGLKKVKDLKPDVVTADLEMPVMDGFSFIRLSMAILPIPIVVVSSQKDEISIFKALDLGAVDFVAKPTVEVSKKLYNIQEELIEKVIIAYNSKLNNVKTIVDKFKDYNIPEEKEGVREEMEEEEESVSLAPACSTFGFNIQNKIELIAIGSSTGGPAALKTLFNDLPINLNVAVVISQHMPGGFTASFAQRLNKNSLYLVKEAKEGDLLEKGKVLIAPGGKHITFVKAGENVLVKLIDGHPSETNVPSVDYMFNSAAEVFQSKVLAVVLTGMGHDGKEGVINISNAGGKVIAESEETAVVFGMPNEAIKTGKVNNIAPLDNIPEVIEKICKES